MKQLHVITGTHKETQDQVLDFFQTFEGKVIGEVGKEATISFIKYGGLRVKFSIIAWFLGSTTTYLISVMNVKTSEESVHFFEGKWDSTVSMTSAYQSITACFPGTLFKHRRGMLRELGELLQNILLEFDGQYTEQFSAEGLTAKMTINRYEVLTDLEWIEQIMEESSAQADEQPFRIVIEHNCSDNDYSAYIPALRKRASGDNLEEVLKEARLILQEALEDAAGRGIPIHRDNSIVDFLYIKQSV